MSSKPTRTTLAAMVALAREARELAHAPYSGFKVGADVHAVSRATISISSATRAIRDSSRAMAKAFLNPADVKP